MIAGEINNVNSGRVSVTSNSVVGGYTVLRYSSDKTEGWALHGLSYFTGVFWFCLSIFIDAVNIACTFGALL